MESSPSLPAIEDAMETTLQAGQCVFSQGQPANNYLVVTRGSVKVFARSSSGKEVVLYRVRESEMCLLTTACMLSHTSYPAEAITETETVARVIPKPVFEREMKDSEPFRRFVFEGLSARLAQVMFRFEQIVLESIRHRLADYLLCNATEEGLVETTHEALAAEIGSAREVVSRRLDRLARAGALRAERGRITIRDRAALETLIADPAL